MGQINQPTPALLLIAVCTRYDEVLAWARQRAECEFGLVALESDPFDFVETDYYRETMGEGLKKQFLVFEQPIDPGQLSDIKRTTNGWEQECAEQKKHPKPRPLNLDPGYLTLAKLVLASTKDHAHRIYLGTGIYAEVTLQYRARRWESLPWTYPDYHRDDYQQFFSISRQLLGRQVDKKAN